MKIRIKCDSKHGLPVKATEKSAGFDIKANLSKNIILEPMERALIGTGIYIELPEGFEAQIRPRSGLAMKHGITVLNSPGTIDADYRGEIKVILINVSDKQYEIKDGERICQMIISRHNKVEWKIVDELSETDRGMGGFGHTGK